jgi:phage tail-like protein
MSGRRGAARMRPLGGSSKWTTASEIGVTVSAGGISLRALRDGSRGLNDPQDTLGGLITPRWLALDARGAVYRLDSRGVVWHLDCVANEFVALAGELGLPRARRTDLAVSRHRIAVVEAEQLRVFDLGSLAIVALLDSSATSGIAVRSVAISHAGPIALDATGRLWRPGPTGWTDIPISGTAVDWRRVAIDRTGGVHVLAGSTDPVLIEVAEDGRRVAEVRDPVEVAARFGPAPEPTDAVGRFSVAGLDLQLERDDVSPQPPLADPPTAIATHERSGSWTSTPIDSGIQGCRWHRVEVALSALPAGATVQVSTASAEDPGSAPADFVVAASLRGPLLAPDSAATPVAGDALVAREGRYLWVRVDLGGDGLATPVLESLRLHYPRISALDDLPAVFSADAESRELLERMLAVFQTTWDELDATIDELPRFLDPATIPEGRTRDPALATLAAWLGVEPEGDWIPGHLRRVLVAEGGLASRRGTVAALREAIELALAGLPGAADRPGARSAAIVEGFTERERLVLGSARTAGLGHPAPLAAASEEGRLRLGNDHLGHARVMAGPSSPEVELLANHAHRFRVNLPAAWVTSEAAEQMLRRAIDAERPAHVAYDLCLVEPRLRVGVQSAIGVDSVIAGPVRTVLPAGNQAHDPDPARRPPPSRTLRGRLGLDAVLVAIDDLPDGIPGAASPGDRRAGIDAVLA